MDNNIFFKRQIELWGEEKQQNLSDKNILIVGAGGLGSNLALTLGASGIGHITIVDFDIVELHNIHRQIAFELKDCGLYKADVLKQKIEARFDKVEVSVYKERFESLKEELLTKKYDLILDATDNFETRCEIDSFAKSSQTPWIYCSVEEFMAQICFFDSASFESFATKKHTPKGIAAPIVSLAASIEANIAIRFLTTLGVECDVLHYIYFDNSGLLELKKFRF